jgi:hypothetical protein
MQITWRCSAGRWLTSCQTRRPSSLSSQESSGEKLGVAAVFEGLPVVDRHVMGNAKEPGHKRDAPGLVACDRLEGVEESLGGQVFGEQRVAGQEEGVAEDAWFVAQVEEPEGFAVAGGGKRY